MTGETEVVRTFKCQCGKVEFCITGDPFAQLNCHCHYCVGSQRFLETKAKGEPSETLQSMNVDFFTPHQLDFSSANLSANLIGNLKVNKNPPSRKYATCCHTFVAIVPPFNKFICINRDGIYNSDGSKYEPSSQAVILNAHKKNSFDPESVPEPSVDGTYYGLLPSLLLKMFNPFGPKFTEKALIGDSTQVVEQIPITWDGE